MSSSISNQVCRIKCLDLRDTTETASMTILPSLCEPSPHTLHMGASLIHRLLSYLTRCQCTHPKPARERVKSMYHFNQNPISLSIKLTCGSSTTKTCGQAGTFSRGASVMYVNENQFIIHSTFLSLFSTLIPVMNVTANLSAH